ncbi:hypothetical protein ES288_D02G126200v1 [Gossypium darwinii]|uniref:Uncharacterized protein n=1 Tax=Gossypium darwinii TaxID=34276 RepID=A0A5D2DCC5_GOSDA|nr:hypothetical protein ES288_D02G126200v1 [Gossypium darwinii]
MRACVDAAPVIDARRANCNLASLGVQRSKPSTPKHGRNFRVMSTFQTGFGGGVGTATAFASAATFPPHYAIQQGIPCNVYGYSSYSPDYSNYPTSYYNVYGGATAQFPMYGAGPGGLITGTGTTFYPYLQFGEGTGVEPLPTLPAKDMVSSIHITSFSSQLGVTHSTMARPCLLHPLHPYNQA